MNVPNNDELNDNLPEWARDQSEDHKVETLERSNDAESKTESDSELENDLPQWTDGLGLRLFRAVEIFTVATAGVVGAGNICLLLTAVTFKGTCLRLFCIALCALTVMAELDVAGVLAEVKLFDVWAFRGLFYCFLGSLTFSTEDSVGLAATEMPPTIFLVMEAFGSVVMFACGIVYLGMGMTCRQQVH